MKKAVRFLFYDAELCLGCHACEIACKEEHNLPVGVNRARIVTEGPLLEKGELKINFKRFSCQHCSNPPCINACPNDAIHQRSDGIVFIDHLLCSGCRSCSIACPHDAVSFHPDSQVAEICDLCFHRLDQGLSPFCAKHCISGALYWGTEEEFEQFKRKIAVNRGKSNE